MPMVHESLLINTSVRISRYDESFVFPQTAEKNQHCYQRNHAFLVGLHFPFPKWEIQRKVTLTG